MNNWPILIGVAVALAGGIYLLAQPLPDNWRDGEYRRHLTKAEKNTLKAGGTVDKVHKAYQTVWRDYYDQGPLRVSMGADGKYKFSPYGEWKRQTNKGRLMAEFNPSADYKVGYWRELWADGSVQFYSYTLPQVVAGDTIDYTRSVNFAPGSRDTAYVQHHFHNKRTNKDAKPSYISFDTQGKRPVPEGWKPQF
ncbi:hypothetical protein [Hymenobacter sp. CRA2]|uniref:hypothetical protein n=1 Tax=Hymenobacter sp. CRA2 TaxID=1955620 RepID=UPI00098FFC7D|nr:hypothetical protein [Hymenobacter sp. CRA2]OON70799.1 hypothetical protein B0919_01955 [Hymenobacter sp. CRA2]